MGEIIHPRNGKYVGSDVRDLGEGDEGEDGAVVGEAGHGEEPEGDREGLHITDLHHLYKCITIGEVSVEVGVV